MASVCVVGTTGLVGASIFTTLSKRPEVATIHAFSRKELPISEKAKAIVSKESESWPQQYPSGSEIFFSGLGTTRGIAGGLEQQRKIDYDLNLELAKAAKAAGTKTYVLISSRGANAGSSIPYPRMKGQLDEAVKALDFERCIILRPGLICGNRNDSRPMEASARRVATLMGSISGGKLKDIWAQDADVIARAAVRAGLDCLEGKEKEKFRILEQADVIRLGRTEWHD